MNYFSPDPKPSPRVKIPYKGLKKTATKPTGEKELFLEIWSERSHVSQVSGEPLGEEPNVWFFAHILSKKSFPRFKLEKFNIKLMTPDEHYEYDHGSPEGENWDKIFELKEDLKIQYHVPKPTV